MSRYLTLYIYALLMMSSGGAIILLIQSPFELMLQTFFMLIMLSAFFTGITAYKYRADQIPLNYHGLHAIGLLIYSLSLLIFASDASIFFNISIFYLLYYGLAELIFGLQMLLQKDQMLFRIIAIRIDLGFLIAITAVGLYISIDKYINLTNANKIVGLLFIACGVNLFFFKTVLIKLYQKENVLTLADTII